MLYRILSIFFGHICHNFHPWEYKEKTEKRNPTINDPKINYYNRIPVKIWYRWQERKCKDCGYIHSSPISVTSTEE